jgi:hypothetical protein
MAYLRKQLESFTFYIFHCDCCNTWFLDYLKIRSTVPQLRLVKVEGKGGKLLIVSREQNNGKISELGLCS